MNHSLQNIGPGTTGVGKVGNPGKNAEKQMLLRGLGEDCPDLTG